MMQPDQAKIFRDVYAATLKSELTATKRCLAAVPDGKGDYTPHPTNMTATALAWHIASSEIWFLDGIINGKFTFEGESARPEGVNTGAEIAAWYENAFAERIARIEAMTGEQLAANLQFAIFNDPTVEYLSFAIRHSVHHRGQLSAYLRPMGAKVPSIYGGSADEPFEMPAQETAAAAQA
jgi:uncharacterized damage-inducible protein DinB